MPTTGAVYETGTITLQDVYRDESLWDAFLDQFTLDEMINLVGDCGYHTRAIDRLGIPATVDNDGPASIKGKNGFFASEESIAFPTETIIACTYNDSLAQQMGVAIGKSAAELGTHVWYAPAANLHRNPLGGRNFEYYSEDPLLSGKMAAAVTRGAQSETWSLPSSTLRSTIRKLTASAYLPGAMSRQCGSSTSSPLRSRSRRVRHMALCPASTALARSGAAEATHCLLSFSGKSGALTAWSSQMLI